MRKNYNQIMCHHCSEKSGVRRHGKARSGLQRYYCSNCKRTFQINYIYQGNEGKIIQQVEALYEQGKSRSEICFNLGVSHAVVDRYLYLLLIEGDA